MGACHVDRTGLDWTGLDWTELLFHDVFGMSGTRLWIVLLCVCHKTQLKDMADNVGVDVDGEGDESRTTGNLIWSLQSSRRDSDLAKVESVLCARENTMKNEHDEHDEERAR
ncbi:hypothetical protein Dsin_009521 [Dipteronia sinensis]|uniref:Uncharacterized protein n=1 Tax=Dipteronia sinensis TaxID=43782 RepID=A0AAE0AQU3_9ROSI|nr:hypothetical protein Dsin_009521 [Dipteronia sinensis]